MVANVVHDALALSPADRLDLIHQLWESLLEDPEGIPLTNEQKSELDRRYEDYLANPDEGHTWEEVEAFVKARLHP
jgi:putative addiction module component (TIGR02574 family)